MKKFTLVIGIMLVFAIYANAQEEQRQHFSGGFYAGVNGAQIDGDAYYGYYHGGLDVAGTVQFPLANKIFLSLDLGFSQKGAQDKFDPSYGNLYKINMNYIDLPLCLHYYDRKRWGFYGGLQYSRLIGDFHEMIDNNLFPYSNYLGVTIVNSNDYEGVLGMSYYFTRQLSLDVRFCYSIASAGYSPESLYRDFAIYNNLFQFRLGYIFGQYFDKDREEKWLKGIKVL